MTFGGAVSRQDEPMSPQREQRLLDVLATIEQVGHVDREALNVAIQRRWGVSGTTARIYIDDLIRRGSVISRFNVLELRIPSEVHA